MAISKARNKLEICPNLPKNLDDFITFFLKKFQKVPLTMLLEIHKK
jgi:hypothetical protein